VKKTVIAALLSTFVAGSAMADDAGKFYLAIDYGSVSFSNGNPGGTEFASPSSLRFAGGYRLSPVVALEVGYVAMADSTLANPAASVTSANSAIQAAIVGTYAVSEAIDLFGKLGISTNTNKLTGTGTVAGLNSSNTSTDFMYGIGAQYNINPQWAIRGQYENLGKHTTSSNLNNAWKVGMTQSSLGVVRKL